MTGELPEPSSEQILDWLDGRLPPEQVGAVEAAVARDGSQAQRFSAWAQEFRRLAGELPLAAPPPVVSQRLRRLHAMRSGRGRPTTRQLARLDVDSRQPDALVAVRGPLLEATSRIQLAFTTEVADVVLDVTPDGLGTVGLRGQVLSRRGTPSAFEVTASGPSGTVRTIEGDDLGSFVLEHVPVDTELIVLTNDDVSIEVPMSAADPPP